MADSEKLAALKKAYADIILNTAKEAAARIMASEKKAQSYQRELFNAKDVALRMLMRLKQMLDSKARQEEMTSLNHQKRIEELEAQLGEAEDIVKDLRAELREIQDELERLAKDKRQPLKEQNLNEIADHVTMMKDSSGPDMSSLPAAQSGLVSTVEMENSASHGTCDGSKFYGEHCAHKSSCFVCNPDFASIMIRSKEPELYRNGCTQRIRAFEGKLIGGSFSLLGEDNGEKKQKLVREDGVGRQRWSDFIAMAESINNQGEWPTEVQVIQPDGNPVQDIVVTPHCRKWKRKRATRCRRPKSPSSESFSDLVVDDKVQTGKNSGTTEMTSEQEWKPLATPKPPSYEKKMDVKSGSKEVTECEIETVTPSLVQSAAKIMDSSTFEIEMAGQQAGSPENSEVPANKMELEVDNTLSGNSDHGVSDLGLLPTSLLKNKSLKYTFTRKRKRDPLSSHDGDSSIENVTSAINMEGKTNDSLQKDWLCS